MARVAQNANKKVPRYLRYDDLPTNRFTPRTYQVDLVDAALQRNTIICLCSSSEKLFIALMVIKELSKIISRPLADGGKRTIYIVNSDDTAENQCQVLSRHTNLQIGFYTIDMETEQWSEQKWQNEFSSKHVLVFTAEVIRDVLSQKLISLPLVNMLIFDDCHRAVGDHAYVKIMQIVESYSSTTQPHIIGLTSSILGSRIPEPNKLKTTINNLETTFNCVAETSMLVISERYDVRPKETVHECLKDTDDDDLVLNLSDIIDSALLFLYECNISADSEPETFKKDPRQLGINVLSEIRNILHQLGTWCASRISEILIPQIEKTEKGETCAINKRFVRFTLTQLRLIVKVFETNFNPDYDVDELLEYSTPKVRKLVRMLQKYKPDLDFMIISSGDMEFSDDDMSDDDDADSMNLSDSDNEDKNMHSPKLIHIAVKRQSTETDGEVLTGVTDDVDNKQLCGLVFVDQQYVALALNKFLEEVCNWDENMCFLKSQHIVGQGYRSAPNKTSIGKVYRKQEEVLRRFRMQEVNLLIATKALEQGVDIPKCNLVVRFDPPRDYKSYTLSKGRARARNSEYVILLDEENKKLFSEDLRLFKEIEEVLIGKNKFEDNSVEEDITQYYHLLPPYSSTGSNITDLTSRSKFTDLTSGSKVTDPTSGSNSTDLNSDDLTIGSDLTSDSTSESKVTDLSSESKVNDWTANSTDSTSEFKVNDLTSGSKVTLKNAIALVNRYCAKLPSDAFTHLTPQCTVSMVTKADSVVSYIGHLRLPINSPIKEEIQGVAMPTKKLAQMAAAQKACELLHKTGELDDQLQPVGKEMFLQEQQEEWEDEDVAGQGRPGTTKRKQYYYKKIADAFESNHPRPGITCYLYMINMTLTGPITDEQNTRGRSIYAPQETSRCLGILSSKFIPQVPMFPVYTRSGEVTVSVDLVRDDIQITEDQVRQLRQFHLFVFTQVLHLDKDPMECNADLSEMGYLIVPVDPALSECVDIEWKFVDYVTGVNSDQKKNVFDSKRDIFMFDKEAFLDAVVMPSYRNIDQPQNFYVAEIRYDLSPISSFPSPELYKTFKDYYTTKYGLMITNTDQPLLDVDHTSARLNLLTPRYMNQKGVALPTSSAETKRARRENLQQKQILIPELCDIHVFPASLWRKAACLPAILYRINYLLLAEEIRIRISRETGIGVIELPVNFRFPQLDFGFETSPDKIQRDEPKKEICENDADDVIGAPEIDLSNKSLPGNMDQNSCVSDKNIDSEQNDVIDASEIDASNKSSADSEAQNSCVSDKNIDSEQNDVIDASEIDASNKSSADSMDQNSCVSDKNIDSEQNDVIDASEIDASNKSSADSEAQNSCVSDKNIDSEQNDVIDASEIDASNKSSADSEAQNSCVSDKNIDSEQNDVIDASEIDASNKSSADSEAQNSCVSDKIIDSEQNDVIDASEIDASNKSSADNEAQNSCVSKQTCSNITEEINLQNSGETKNIEKVNDKVNIAEKQLISKTVNCEKLKSDKTNIKSEKCDSSSDSDSGMVSSASDASIKYEEKTSETVSDVNLTSYNHPMDCLSQNIKNTELTKSPSPQCYSNCQCHKNKMQNVKLQNNVKKSHGEEHSVNKIVSSSIIEAKSDSLPNVNSDSVPNVNSDSVPNMNSDSVPNVNLDNKPDMKSNSMTDMNSKSWPNVKLDSKPNVKSDSVPNVNSDSVPNMNSDSVPNMNLNNKHDIKSNSMTDLNSESWPNVNSDSLPNSSHNSDKCHVSVETSPESDTNDEFSVGVWNSPSSKSTPTTLEEENKDFKLPEISLDEDRDLETFVGPSPCLILQALTMSNANDFFSLERLETIGDSFLKYAITVYLYCSYPGIHEGKLSYLRSKQVSNYNLYRLGQKRGIAECMVSSKFEPYENWLPPCYIINEDRRRGPVPKVLIAGTKSDKSTSNFVLEEKDEPSKNFAIGTFSCSNNDSEVSSAQMHNFNQELKMAEALDEIIEKASDSNQCLIPYSLQTQHGIPDKSVADCSEALIGCYLTTCGKKAALMFMSWLGLKVLPKKEKLESPVKKEGQQVSEYEFEDLKCPISPLIISEAEASEKLKSLLDGYDDFEESIQYKFNDRSYLLQAFTHASYHYNTVTDCYQRLEFLGDAILDYIITRHLYEDSQKHSPGILTDLRSALVNNNIFAALAVKWDFHKYFKAISPALFQVIEKFVSRQKDREDEIELDDEFTDKEEEDEEEGEEVEMEIPKALGDIFESVAGAVYLDSGMSLDTVWNVYYRLMKPQIEKYLKCIPKSPVRELLEMEPETAKFEKPERTMDGKIRVTVNVVGKGVFSGIGRNYRIAKSAAAKKALRCMKTMQQQGLI